MSYDIELQCHECKRPVIVDKFTDGGTYAIGGSDIADLNVTYNYYTHFHFKELDGKKAVDVISVMQKAVDRLGTERSEDYWEDSKGNAGHAVNILLKWAKDNPNAIFEVI